MALTPLVDEDFDATSPSFSGNSPKVIRIVFLALSKDLHLHCFAHFVSATAQVIRACL